MYYPASFVSLINYLERFELPSRNRIRKGEIVAGKLQAKLAISAKAHAISRRPPVLTSSDMIVEVYCAAIDSQTVCGALYASVTVHTLASKVRKREPRPVEERKPVPGSRAPRSQEASAASAAKIRAQREARIAILLPLVERARLDGCVLLSEIAAWLDNYGHRPERGSNWSTGTLSLMLPREQERRDRDDLSAKFIEHAKVDGAKSLQEIADWLNERGHRTARNVEWTAKNVSRFIQSRVNSEPR